MTNRGKPGRRQAVTSGTPLMDDREVAAFLDGLTRAGDTALADAAARALDALKDVATRRRRRLCGCQVAPATIPVLKGYLQ